MEEWERLLDQLRAELVLREKELELLHEIDLRLLTPGKPSQDIFGFIVRETRELLRADHSTILLRRSTFLEPMYSNTESVVGQVVPIAKSLTGLSLESGKAIMVSDLATSEHRERYAPLRGYEGPEMRSLLATPIQVSGTAVGVLNVESSRPFAFKAVHERIAKAIAAQVSIALQQTQTLASSVLFADVDRLILMSNNSGDIVQQSQHVVQTALEKVMTELQRLEHIKHTAAQILIVRSESGLEILNSTIPSEAGLMVPVDNSVSGRAVRQRETIIVDDVDEDPEYQRIFGSDTRSEIAVPILYGEENDLVIGVLNVESAELNAFSEFYKIVLESFAEKVRTLLTFTKLRTDVIEALEVRSADDLLVAVGDQTTHLIHRLNNTVGAMRMRIMELQDRQKGGEFGQVPLAKDLDALLALTERALKMPEEITRLLSQEGAPANANAHVRDALRQIVLSPDLDVELDLADNVPTLPLYCFDIVVQNLIQNAVDAMPEGGKLTITSSVVSHPTLPAGYLQLSIRDTGEGISPEVRNRIFELNFTTKSSRGKGLGLGLWWVRNFVRRARGDILIDSAVGSGTEVTVKIPFEQGKLSS